MSYKTERSALLHYLAGREPEPEPGMGTLLLMGITLALLVAGLVALV